MLRKRTVTEGETVNEPNAGGPQQTLKGQRRDSEAQGDKDTDAEEGKVSKRAGLTVSKSS